MNPLPPRTVKLSKVVCKSCINHCRCGVLEKANEGTYLHKEPWSKRDDKLWDDPNLRVVYCPITTIETSLYMEPPVNCRFRLEHLMETQNVQDRVGQRK